jgi:hypothetical protein
MNQADAGNPYQAPEASIVALRDEIRRPPVYTAISLFCWLLAAIHVLGSVVLLYVFGTMIDRVGWRDALLFLVSPRPRPSLMIATMLVASAAYVVAGRLLWNRRGRPGLILCVTAVGLTYFYFGFLRPS